MGTGAVHEEPSMPHRLIAAGEEIIGESAATQQLLAIMTDIHEAGKDDSSTTRLLVVANEQKTMSRPRFVMPKLPPTKTRDQKIKALQQAAEKIQCEAKKLQEQERRSKQSGARKKLAHHKRLLGGLIMDLLKSGVLDEETYVAWVRKGNLADREKDRNTLLAIPASLRHPSLRPLGHQGLTEEAQEPTASPDLEPVP